MSSVMNNTKTPTPKTQQQLFEVANEIALKYAQDYNWSTWHTWNVVDEGKKHDETGLRGMDRHFWALTRQFGSCLGASTRIITDLETTLDSHVDMELRQYAKTVQLMTSAQKADADTKYHAVVATCFDDFAIVIDHALHPTAFKVPLGEYFNMAPYIPLFGSEGQERFKYFLADGEHKLTMDNKETTYGPLYFSEMDINKATDQIAVPAALEKQPVKDQEHILMPPRKYVSVRSLLDQQPDLIAAVPVHDKWLATTVRIQVDFANPMITMQIPMKDWLLTPQKEGWREQICCNTPEGLQIVANDATVRLELKLNATKREVPHHELSGFIVMEAIGEQFGLDSEVLKNMMWSVYRVWAPYRPQRTDCALDA